MPARNAAHAAYPSADDFRRAVGTPALSFDDVELKQGTARLNRMGLPTVWSGQFASVYRLETPAGPRAVRCFTAQVSDHQARYAALHTHLRGRAAPMLADFAFLPKGIRIAGTWRPIVKMEWVEGLPLDRVVEEAVEAGDRARIAALAEVWIETMRGLARSGVTHGDLQHENILVRSESVVPSMRLVDYDGVWVPALHGRAALESGHPHYQHPARGRGEFGPHLDSFPALLILLSLRALAVEPQLWRRFHTDKHLILRNDDLRTPWQSPLLLALTRSPSDDVRRLTLELVQACGQPPAQVKPPAELAAGAAAGWGTRARRTPNPAAALGAAAPGAAAPDAQADVDWRRTWGAGGVAGSSAAPPQAEQEPEARRLRVPLWLGGATGGRLAAALAASRHGTARAMGAGATTLTGAREAGAALWATLLRAEPAPPAPLGASLLLTLTVGLLAAGAMGALGAAGFGQLAVAQGAWGRQALSSFLLGLLAPALLVSTRRMGAAAGAHALALLLLLGASRPGWSPLLYAGISTLAAAGPLWPLRGALITPRAALVSALLGLVVRAAAAALLWSESGNVALVVAEMGAALAAGALAVGVGAGLRALVAWLAAAFTLAP